MYAVVHGRVQGVGFRAFVQLLAQRHELRGWVRNLPNGTVEMLAEGDANALHECLRQVQRGPGLASVSHVDHRWLDATGEFDHFRVLR